MKRIRVCMICSQFYPIVGGTEKQAEKLAAELVKRGHTVFVLTQRIKGLKDKQVREGVIIYRRIFAPALGPLFGLFYMISTFLFLWYKRKEYDLIHCHILYLHTVSAVIIKKIFRKKIIVKIAGARGSGDIQSLKNISFFSFFLKIFKKVDFFVSISREIEGELRNIGISRSKIVYIPNGVDTEKFSPASGNEKQKIRDKLSLKKDHIIICSVNRIIAKKGIDYLINAFKELTRKHPRLLLLIIGEGPEERNLKALVKDLKLEDNVIFTGFKNNIDEYLKASDIYVTSSLAEGLSGTLLEAMACGLPCIATRIGGNTDLIEDKVNGLLINCADSMDMAEKIQQILKDHSLPSILGEKARLKIENDFSLSEMIKRYIQLYEELGE